MNEMLLRELMQTYKELYNLEMGVNDEPVTSVDVEYHLRDVPTPAELSVKAMSVQIVSNGLTLSELYRLVTPEDDHAAVREELSREMIASMFSMGVHVFKIRKMKEVLDGCKN